MEPVEENKSVLVGNISPSANEKTVSDFFSFCGKINQLYLTRDGEHVSAIIQFDTESAAKTALLLSNALIVDRPISVVPFTNVEGQKIPAPDSSNQVPPSQITQREFPVPDDERTKTSVIASLIASGYVIASDTLAQAKEFDEKHMLSLQAKVAMEKIKVKAHEVDQQLGISEKVAAVKTSASEQVKKLDEGLHISETATQIGNTIKTGAADLSAKVKENQTINQGLTKIEEGVQSVKGVYNDYKEQTQRAIEEKQRQKIAVAPGAQPTVADPQPTPQPETSPVEPN